VIFLFLIEKGDIFQRTKQIFIQDIINLALEVAGPQLRDMIQAQVI